MSEAMRMAVIKDGAVINTILATEDFSLDGHTLVASLTAQIGDLWNGQAFSAPPVDLSKLQTDILAATQGALDAFAQTRNYSGILSACTYKDSAVPQFAAEGAYCVQLRDQTWATLYEMLAEVQAGSRAIPAGYADIAGELPVSSAAWPA